MRAVPDQLLGTWHIGAGVSGIGGLPTNFESPTKTTRRRLRLPGSHPARVPEKRGVARLTPLPWHRLVCVFEQLGYRQAGQKGSHIKLEKPGAARPLIIPRYKEVDVQIIVGLIHTAGITRKVFLYLLERC